MREERQPVSRPPTPDWSRPLAFLVDQSIDQSINRSPHNQIPEGIFFFLPLLRLSGYGMGDLPSMNHEVKDGKIGGKSLKTFEKSLCLSNRQLKLETRPMSYLYTYEG